MKSESRSNGREWIKGRKERERERESGVEQIRHPVRQVETTQKVDDSSAVGPPLTGEPPPKP